MNNINTLVFGKDDTQHIVNITLKNDQIYLYKEVNGKVELERFSYTPWVLSRDSIKPHSERLKGNQYWKYITSTTSEKFSALAENYQRDLWIPRSAVECFTLCEGATYFKGLKVADVSILSFDIETNGLAMNADSKVYIISNTFRKGDTVVKQIFSLEDYTSEFDMIEDWTDWVVQMDPSVMCGHNIFGYDLPFLAHCFGKPLILGRDLSALTFDTKTSKFRKDGSQEYDYHNAHITGREIIDTFFLSIKYDIGRDFPSYGLKPIVKHLGLEKQGRAFIDAGKISKYYDGRATDPDTWQKVKDYALDDSEDALKLYDKMIPAYFYLNQSVPKSFQQMINEASGSQLDSLMVRSYLQDGYSQPKTSNAVPFEGAISMGRPGIYNWVAKADVASLYPSIMLEKNIHDNKKDPNNHLIQILSYYRDERLANKKLAKLGDKYAEQMSEAQKIVINSMYGFLGAGYLLYNYPEGAAAVTRYGREILLKGVEYVSGHTLVKVVKEIVNEGTEDEKEKFAWILGDKVTDGLGYQLVNVDTDSFTITNGNKITKAAFGEFLKVFNTIFSSLISWDDDGIYEKVIVLGSKNYVLVKSDEYLKPGENKVKFKGSAVTDQKKEPALTEMLEKSLYALLADEPASIVPIYRGYVREAMNIKDINRWATKKTVTKAVLFPKRLTEQKILNAMHETMEMGVQEGYSEGDKVWVYSALDGMIQASAKGELVFYKDGRPKMIDNEILRDVRMFEQDQNSLHYVSRVLKTVEILGNVIDLSLITDYTLKSKREALNELTFTSECVNV